MIACALKTKNKIANDSCSSNYTLDHIFLPSITPSTQGKYMAVFHE